MGWNEESSSINDRIFRLVFEHKRLKGELEQIKNNLKSKDTKDDSEYYMKYLISEIEHNISSVVTVLCSDLSNLQDLSAFKYEVMKQIDVLSSVLNKVLELKKAIK